MAVHRNITFGTIDGWCAGTKIMGLNSVTIEGLKWTELQEKARLSARELRSVMVASVNIEETEVIAWLEKNKFKAGPWFRNHGHAGRKTALFFKQVSKARYNDEL